MPDTSASELPGDGWTAPDATADDAVPNVADELSAPARTPATAPCGKSKIQPHPQAISGASSATMSPIVTMCQPSRSSPEKNCGPTFTPIAKMNMLKKIVFSTSGSASETPVLW